MGRKEQSIKGQVNPSWSWLPAEEPYQSPSSDSLIQEAMLGPQGRGIPKENLVVTIDGVKNRETLHAMARSIDYVGLCRTVHPDGSGCP